MSSDTFEVESFVAECQAARVRADWPEAIAAILRRAIERPEAIARAIAKRRVDVAGLFDVFLQSPDLTIYQIEGLPGLVGPPHDHATKRPR